jgi:acyl carrier protein
MSEIRNNGHDTRERLRRILIDQLNYTYAPETIRPETPLYGKGLGLDSVDVVSLMVRLEEEFEIFFEAEEVVSGIQTFGSLLQAIERKLEQNGC